MKKRPSGAMAPKNPLKQVFIAGLALALVIAWSMVIFSLFWGRDIGRPDREGSFSRELRNYDLSEPVKTALEGGNPEAMEKRLALLQKSASGVEEHLSALKRRRMLALADRRYISGYAKAAKEAAAAFPYSAPLAAVASEAVLLESPLAESVSPLLDNYARRVSQNRFGLLELSLHVLAGNLDDPVRAAEISGLGSLLAADANFPPPFAAELRLDDFLLLAAKNDIRSASAKLDALLSSPDSGRQDIIQLGADFYYDFNNPMKAAELYLRLGGEREIARAADALVLAGEIPGARNIWIALSSGQNAGNPPDALASPYGNREAAPREFPATGNEAARERLDRILYNLAVSSADSGEEKQWLEKLFSGRSRLARGGRNLDDATGTFSIIRYTRLLDTPDSIAALTGTELPGAGQNPLLDLELLRRRMETLPQQRAAAETWMLINRHSADEALYEWAAWYFDHQKLYEETARVMKEAERRAMSGSWLALHRSLALLLAGKTGEAEKILKDEYLKGSPDWRVPASPDWRIPANPDWRVPANLGRIQESRRAIALALEYYEAAAGLVRENKAAARIQMRVSRCLAALGQTRESRRALETALELDPDDINIRRELRRLGD